MRTQLPKIMLTGLVGGTLLLSGCASATSDASEAPGADAGTFAEVDEAAAALLPDDIASAGTVEVGVIPTQGEPWSYQAEGSTELEGFSIDLATAIAEKLGLEVEFVNTSFDAMIPGLEADRFDFGSLPMLDTAERQELVDFVNYLNGGSAFLVASPAEGATADLTLETLCGLTVGAGKGTLEAVGLTEAEQGCAANGEELVVQEFDSTADGVLAVVSGRLDAYYGAVAAVDFAAKQNDKLERSGEAYNSGLSSMPFPKGSELTEAAAAAFQSLIDDGTYLEIAESYGLDMLALDEATINAGTQ